MCHQHGDPNQAYWTHTEIIFILPGCVEGRGQIPQVLNPLSHSWGVNLELQHLTKILQRDSKVFES